MLRPVETPTREIKKLDGLWAFSLDRENCGIDQRWWESALQESRAIAVPGSFNDQFADADIRNYAGNVWYQREVFIPKGWAGQRIVLRFDAVTHYGKVWVNNQEVMEHQGGYTPFEADVTPYGYCREKCTYHRLCEQRTELADYPAGNGDYRRKRQEKAVLLP